MPIAFFYIELSFVLPGRKVTGPQGSVGAREGRPEHVALLFCCNREGVKHAYITVSLPTNANPTYIGGGGRTRLLFALLFEH